MIGLKTTVEKIIEDKTIRNLDIEEKSTRKEFNKDLNYIEEVLRLADKHMNKHGLDKNDIYELVYINCVIENKTSENIFDEVINNELNSIECRIEQLLNKITTKELEKILDSDTYGDSYMIDRIKYSEEQREKFHNTKNKNSLFINYFKEFGIQYIKGVKKYLLGFIIHLPLIVISIALHMITDFKLLLYGNTVVEVLICFLISLPIFISIPSVLNMVGAVGVCIGLLVHDIWSLFKNQVTHDTTETNNTKYLKKITEYSEYKSGTEDRINLSRVLLSDLDRERTVTKFMPGTDIVDMSYDWLKAYADEMCAKVEKLNSIIYHKSHYTYIEYIKALVEAEMLYKKHEEFKNKNNYTFNIDTYKYERTYKLKYE